MAQCSPDKHRTRLSLALLACVFFLAPSAFAATSVPFTVNFSEIVNVTGTPRIAVDVGGVTRYANYISGSGSTALTFTYDAVAGDVDLDGVALSSPLDLNGGTLKDAVGNDLNPLAFTLPTTTGIKIDYPSLSMDFVADSDGRYTLNGTVYNTLSAFLTATGGSFSRTSSATYFDSTGTLQTAPPNTIRFNYDPATLTSRGILIEQARTNSLRNGQGSGAVVGNPGTLPTYWVNAPLLGNGLNTEIVQTGTEGVLQYTDIRIYGTSSSTTPAFYFEGGTQVVASQAQNWTHSVFLQRVGGSMAGITAINLRFVERTSGGSIIVTQDTPVTIPTTGSLSSSRFSTSRTLTDATTAYIHSGIRFTAAVGIPIDITLRIAGAQLELGSFPTSYIPTTSAAASRTADNLAIPTGAWFSGTSSTLYGYGSTMGINSASTFADINNNSFAQRFQIRMAGGFTYSGIITKDNVVQAVLAGGTTTANIPAKIVMAATNNNGVLYAGGILRSSSSSLTMPVSQVTLRIGGVATGTEFLNGHLQTIKYYPTRVLNPQLQLMTQ